MKITTRREQSRPSLIASLLKLVKAATIATVIGSIVKPQHLVAVGRSYLLSATSSTTFILASRILASMPM